MSGIQACGGVKQMVLLPIDSDWVHITVQLLDVVTLELKGQGLR
jgi:hypothetical protein